MNNNPTSRSADAQPSTGIQQVASTASLSKRFGAFTAIDDVNIAIEEHRIYGLLGRNGAGKTTLMQLLSGQQFPTSGTVKVYGQNPAEHAMPLSNLCFIAESQKYPDNFMAKHVFRSAPWFFERWDADFAAELIADFRLPLNRQIKKLSRGQLSAVGVIVGLASRAPLTFFDEPYLGLDAVARQIFYDRLIADYAEHPRTIVLSTHLIDEAANLLEHVFVIDQGRIVLDSDADEVRGSATTVAGANSAVEDFVKQHRVIERSTLGGLSAVTVQGRLDQSERVRAAELGIELAPVSLQQYIVHLTGADLGAAASAIPSSKKKNAFRKGEAA